MRFIFGFLFFFVLGPLAVLAFVRYFRSQNEAWARGEASYHDRFAWLGDLIRSFLNRSR